MVITMTEIEQAIHNFINELCEIGNDPDFTAEINIFDFGFVDSLDAAEIISFIEDNWKIEITQSDIMLYPMNSVREIAAVVETKLKG
jgi:D-alanine--poly(phosphoribitol) ligase subunit 2